MPHQMSVVSAMPVLLSKYWVVTQTHGRHRHLCRAGDARISSAMLKRSHRALVFET
jgi:hypothetical protein